MRILTFVTRHLSSIRRMHFRLHPLAIALALVAFPGVAIAADDELPPAVLKPAEQLTPPPLRPAPGTLPGTAPKTPGATPAPIPRPPFAPDSGAIFFRAEAIDGVFNKEATATGKVELRTRRETVLADWLHYDFGNDGIWGKADVLLPKGVDC